MDRLSEQYKEIVSLWRQSDKDTSYLTSAIKQFNENYLMNGEESENCERSYHEFIGFNGITGAFCIHCGDILPF